MCPNGTLIMHEVYVAFTGAIASVVSRRRRSYSINTKNELIDAKYDVDPGPVHPLETPHPTAWNDDVVHDQRVARVLGGTDDCCDRCC